VFFIAADQRLAPRVAVMAIVLLWATVFLRLASDDRLRRPTNDSEGTRE
jgi:hypothetical protein